jgi:hypothetical protein
VSGTIEASAVVDELVRPAPAVAVRQRTEAEEIPEPDTVQGEKEQR